MTTTPTIFKLDATTKTVAVPFLTRSSLQSVTTDTGNAKSVALYRITTGDPGIEANARVSIYDAPDANGGAGKITVTAKLETVYQLVDDTSSDVLVEGPASCSITLVMPGRTAVPDNAQILRMIGNTFSLFFHDTDVSDVPLTDVVDSLAYSIATVNA